MVHMMRLRFFQHLMPHVHATQHMPHNTFHTTHATQHMSHVVYITHVTQYMPHIVHATIHKDGSIAIFHFSSQGVVSHLEITMPQRFSATSDR